jgi:hypothetical protein
LKTSLVKVDRKIDTLNDNQYPSPHPSPQRAEGKGEVLEKEDNPADHLFFYSHFCESSVCIKVDLNVGTTIPFNKNCCLLGALK